MKKIIFSVLVASLLSVSFASAGTLYEFFKGNLPSIKERAKIYLNLGHNDTYRGTAKQNTELLTELQTQTGSSAPTLTFGAAFNPSGGKTYRLQSSISSSATSLTLTAFKEPVSNIPYTMSYLNSSIEYATLEPQNDSSKEFVSFTGITQNADGTATLTGVTRGLGFSYPYTASSTLQQAHPGQSIFILSNPPQLTNQYANKSNDESITGLWNFTQAPIDNGSSTSTLQFATRGYVNSVAVSGAATSTFTQSGISTLATGAQAAAGTYTLNQPGFLSTALSTSTCTGFMNNSIVVTKTNSGQVQTIDPNCIATSSPMQWTGSTTFSGATGVTFGTTGTTTIQATTTTSGLDVRGGTSGLISRLILATTTNTTAGNSSTASSTLLTFTVPPNVLYQANANGAVRVHLNVSNWGCDTGCFIEFQYGGATIFTLSTTTGAQALGTGVGSIDFELMGNNATNSQEGVGRISLTALTCTGGTCGTPRTTNYDNFNIATLSIDSTNAQTFSVVGRFNASSALNLMTVSSARVNLER